MAVVLSKSGWHERCQAITEGTDDDGMSDDARDRILCSLPSHQRTDTVQIYKLVHDARSSTKAVSTQHQSSAPIFLPPASPSFNGY